LFYYSNPYITVLGATTTDCFEPTTNDDCGEWCWEKLF